MTDHVDLEGPALLEYRIEAVLVRPAAVEWHCHETPEYKIFGLDRWSVGLAVAELLQEPRGCGSGDAVGWHVVCISVESVLLSETGMRLAEPE